MKKRIILVMVLLAAMLSFSIVSYAAKGSFSANPMSANIKVGGNTSIKITANNCGGKFTISSSDNSVASVSESSKWIESGSGTITVTAKKAGTATITIKAEDVGDTSENEVTGSIPVKITVTEQEDQKKDPPPKATIKKLVVAGKTYNNPSKNITVKVDNDVTNAKISVTTSNGESYTINKGNNVKLEEGTNTVKITLASGNVYTVNIRRAAKEDDTPNIIDEPKPEEKILLKSLKLQGVNLEEEKVELSYSPEFSSEVYEYSVNVANDIKKIDVEALANKEDYTVEITGNEELKEGENIITILVKAKDSDKVTTYKIKVIKEEAVEAVATLDETPNTGEELKDNNIIKIVIVTFTALVAIAGIVFAVIEYNYSKKHPKEKMGKIPYSNIGFKDEETDKEDILEEQKDKKEENEDKDNNREEDKPKKRGKHF